MFRLFHRKPLSIIQSQRDWYDWKASNMAQNLANLEQNIIDPLMEKTFGNHLLQISMAGAQPLYQQSRVANKTIVHFEYPVDGLGHAVIAEPDYLPIANESIDTLILHHVLEFSDNPHQILREAQRALASGGRLFVLGFNPWSLWRMRKYVSLSRRAPWNGNYLSRSRIGDWLSLLDFNLQNTQLGFFEFPVNSERLISSCDRFERLGQKYNCFFGGFYVMVARKQVAGLTPLRNERRKRRIVPFPVTEPTIRNLKSSD